MMLNTKNLLILIFYFSLIPLAFLFLILNFPDIIPFVVAIAFFFGIFALNLIFKFSYNELFFVILSAYLFLLGEPFVFNLFNTFFLYDKIIHFLIMFFIGFLVIRRIDREKYPFLIPLLVMLGIGATWEIYEYLSDIVFGYGMQGVFDCGDVLLMERLDDTILDLSSGGLGGICSLLVNKFRKWK